MSKKLELLKKVRKSLEDAVVMLEGEKDKDSLYVYNGSKRLIKDLDANYPSLRKHA